MATESFHETETQAESVDALIKSIDNNINYFDKSAKSKSLSTNLRQLKSALEKSARAVSEIEKFMNEYDFETTKGNGYRSFQYLQISAVKSSSKVCERLINSREKMFFRADNYAKEFDEWTQIFDNLSLICESLIKVHGCDSDDGRNLFVDSLSYDSILTQTVAAINPKAFYGETMGFQFCPSMRPILKVIVSSMASYYSYFFKDNSKPAKIFNLPNSFLRYLFNGEKRAGKYLHASENSTTEFCQSFWNLTEKRIAQTIPIIMAAKVEVNKVFKIHPTPLQIENNSGLLVDVPLPESHIGLAPIACRLMSAKKRKGMFGVKTNPSHGELSKYLVFHCHGGGWTAQTSKSHEIYMRDWTIMLDAPIISIDYSLTPTAPFPRACEEVFWVYCWALQNAELLGSTGENIVFVGDSAGGNLVTSCLVQCIEKGIPKPKGILCIYTPQWLGFIMSPSRFLSLVDPVLPFGFTTRLSKSYCQKHETVDENDNKVESHAVTKKHETSKRRIIYESYEQEFDIKVHDSYLVSPYLAPDEILKQFPPTVMLSTNLDPCLDDGIQMAKRLNKLNVDVEVEVLNGLSHGFLYFSQISKECHEGSMVCVDKMKKLLEI